MGLPGAGGLDFTGTKQNNRQREIMPNDMAKFDMIIYRYCVTKFFSVSFALHRVVVLTLGFWVAWITAFLSDEL